MEIIKHTFFLTTVSSLLLKNHLSSLYPFCSMTHRYVLGQPEVVIGPQVKNFEWKKGQLFFPNNKGILSPVEGDF